MHFIDGKDCMVSEWILLITAYAFVGLRLYTRRITQRESLRASEWILIVAAIDALGLVICDTVTFHLNGMDHWFPSVGLSKASFASNYLYDVGMSFPKLSMLAFYWVSFPTNRPILRKAVHAVTAYVCAAYTVILWTDTFYCGVPVSIQWSQEDGACSVFYATTPFYFNFAVDLSSYVFIYMLTFCLLTKIVKEFDYTVYLPLCLGIVPTLMPMIRFVVIKADTTQPNLVCILSVLEMATALAVVSMAGLQHRSGKGCKIDKEAVSVSADKDDFLYLCANPSSHQAAHCTSMYPIYK